MSLWNKYPYSTMHELNLDWILHLMQELHADWDEFTALNKITNAGAWDITKQYQAWTVVSDNNVGYISFKAVPAGIAINNTEYWGVIADYNILITDLSSRISALENDNVSNKNRISTLENDNVSNKNRISNLESYVHPFNKVIFIGDSYMTRNTEQLAVRCAEYMRIPLANYIVSAKGSTGFARPADGKRFIDLLTDVSTAFDHDEVSHIIVLGGANDSLCTDADIISYMEAFITYAQTEYQHADICVGFIGATSVAADIPDYARACITYKQVCEDKHIRYLNNVEYVMHNNYYLESDNVHPTPYATNILAQKCADAMLYGAAFIHYKWKWNSQSFDDIYVELVNDKVQVYTKVRGGNKTFSPHITWNANDIQLVDTILSTMRITPPSDYSMGCPASCEIFYSSGTLQKTLPGTLIISGNGIYIRNDGYDNISDVNLSTVPQFNIVYPTLYV